MRSLVVLLATALAAQAQQTAATFRPLHLFGDHMVLPAASTVPIGGVEKDTNERNALGFDYDGDGKGSGYNAPSLLGGFGSPPYFHNGACETYACVLSGVTHRRAGLPANAQDPLEDPRARRRLAAYLEAIDEQTRPHRREAAGRDEAEE